MKSQYSSTVAKGLVIDQTPDQGTNASRGTQIDIVVSKGEEPAAPVTVPDLKGMTPSEAEAALTKVGLKGQAGDSVYAEGVDVGTIATQSPAANSSAKAGDTVTYQLSKGTEQVEVPSVVGDGENGATSTLEAAGFGVTTEYEASDSVDKGYVISQSPSSGTADKGSTVTIKVSTGPTTIDASQYVGASEGSATSALQNKGVTVTVEYKSSGSHAAGTVISVSPSSTKKGGSVTLTVSSGSASGGTDANGGGSSNNGSGGTGNNGGTPSS